MVGVDMPRLIGPSYALVVAAANRVDLSLDLGSAASATPSRPTTTPPTMRLDASAIDDARARYLARKAARK